MLKVKSKSSQKNLVLDKDLLDILYPIGTLYFTQSDTNPEKHLGGKWQEFANGRCIMGTGTYNDGSSSQSFWNGQTGGKFNKQLSVDEIPAHTHAWYIARSDTESSGYGLTYSNYFKNRPMIASDRVSISASTGGSAGFSIMQPFIAVRIWKRVS